MGNVCVIGPRSSGKTTYLAALAYKGKGGRQSKNFKIIPGNDDTRNLKEKAEEIICEGEGFEPNVIGQNGINNVSDLPVYLFNIEIKPNLVSKSEVFQLTVRDYPGEVFEKIENPKLSDSVHQEFINECLNKDVLGCLILLTSWDKGIDNFYSRVMTRFIELMGHHDRTHDLRLAIAMSKCERGELWPGRIDPETDLFKVHLPKTREILREEIRSENLSFYAISTFGVLSRNDPRPNRIDDQGKDRKASVLREPKHWQPYNIIEPLYWLGKPQKQLITTTNKR